MIVENALGPTETQIKAMQAQGPGQPICLINMLKYKANAHRLAGLEGQLNIETIKSQAFPCAFD